MRHGALGLILALLLGMLSAAPTADAQASTKVFRVGTLLAGSRPPGPEETIPKLSRVAVLWNSADGGMTLRFRQIQIAAGTL